MTAILLTKTACSADMCTTTDSGNRVTSQPKLKVLTKGRFKGWLFTGSGSVAAIYKALRAIEKIKAKSGNPGEVENIGEFGKDNNGDLVANIVIVSPKGECLYAESNTGELYPRSLPTFLGCDGPLALAAHLGGASPTLAIDIAAGLGLASGKGKLCFIVKDGKWIQGI